MDFFKDRYAKVDNKAMEDGAPVDFGGGFIVTVRHVSSEKVNLERAKITKQLRVMNRNRDLTPEQQKRITSHVAAHAGIVTWDGSKVGVPEFSPEFAEKVFAERPEFLDDVIEAMTTYETFRDAEVSAAAGN
jgi:hypothetical protein